ncbi:contractile injection system protein, VgrG/Pvc8 family [Paenibacillus sp. cl130]|uniref:contractile injection system protein, VgrG/Pvc8 family n=1 Tax=Paenibacillus sp. cl130 TaxID=1761876 RepID=UPI0008E6A6BE|nr:contractile injection system protein, VgrG/Pvc8 family [Paenibacillus sp. cl130]SFR23284.1 Phage late control gene D protein (GPD) [Paenibacillus sp. cl130]
MSVLSDGIGYESLRFYGPFQPLHIEQLQITRAINDHAFLHISGMLSEEQGAVCIGQDMEQEPIVIRQLDDQGQSLRRLFHGIVTRMSVHCVRDVYTFELEAASHSYQMDIKRKRRSYQDIHRTYDDLVTALVRKYQYGDAIDTVSNHAKLETFVLQYEETDWAFLKRLASRFDSVLVPEVTAASPKVFFGMPEGKQHKVERDVFYRVRKTFHELDAEKPGERAGSYVTYMIENLQYYALGDLITLPIGQGKELVVVRAVTTLTDGLLRTRYDLQAEQDIRYARYENDQVTGISLTGTVLKVQQDFVQLQLDIDPKQDPAKACWFPVATRYVAEEHSGWYDMPEIGEQVELYLPTHREQDAYVTDSLRQQRHTNGQPNVKVWQHVQGSGVEMSEHELTLSTSGEFSITLHESSGITIDSPGNVQIQGGHVKLDAGEELSLEAGTALYLKGGSSSMVLDGETDTKAPVIYQEGTVKAPVFVADLPPVPEPPLMSIKAYEAAQAPSAAKTSSSSTPTAKVTSPAALQQANSLLGTVSKLLGSIPVMGKVAGVVAGALGGPAAGVILKATAMIPVRSKGTPTIGGGKGNGIHPLKHLAGLALQGLINQYEHDQARQAYYSKWILGKVFTSARHIAHSGGPLELIQNLLKESNAMVHTYQQIPVDLRQRWRANYDRYMAQQAKPKQEEESQSWWDLMAAGQLQNAENEAIMAKQMANELEYTVDVSGEVVLGAAAAVVEDYSFGIMNKEYSSNHPMARKTGEVIGHSLTTVAGAVEMTGAVVEGFFGGLVTSTGVAAPVGVGVIVQSALLGAHGAGVTYTGASNSVQSAKDLYRMSKSEGPNSSPPSKPAGAKSGKSEGTPTSQKPSKLNEKLPETKETKQVANNFKWGNPKSTPTYGHTFSEHGAKKKPNQLIDRARGKGHQISQWIDENSAADFLAEVAKKGPGVHEVPLPSTIKSRGYLPDGTEIKPDMARVIVKEDGGIRSAFPYSSAHPSGIGK